MGSRVPVHQHYNLRSANSYIGSSLHDLNTVDGRPGDIEGIGPDSNHDAVTDDSMDNDEESSAVDCMHDSYRNSLPLHAVGVEEDRSSLDNNGSSTGSFDILTVEDVSPIETARARFLDIIVDNFINPHVVEVPDSEIEFTPQSAQDKLSKRKSKEIRYEGDSQYVLPLMYVANMYETLAHEVSLRLSSLNAMRDKSIGVALEAAGGLYRKIAKKFPRKGPCVYRRRELATSFETRSRFPELVIQEEKRVRFVVVNGLEIIEKPTNLCIADAEWFKRLTGRNEVAVCARDYKFYAPRHKYRRVSSNAISNLSGLPTISSPDTSSALDTTQGYRSVSDTQNQPETPSKHLQSFPNQAQFHHLHQSHQLPINQAQHVAHFSHQQCGPPSHLAEIAHAQQSSSLPNMGCLQTLSHVGGRLHVLPTSPAKYCDECGAPYLRDTSKFCSECGTRRLGT